MPSGISQPGLTDSLVSAHMLIEVQPLAIPGLCLIEPHVYRDDRGYLMEVWNQSEFAEATGFAGGFVQENQSRSEAGVLRGLHYQMPRPQGKLVRVVRGAVFTVAVDLRLRSHTFSDWAGIELSADNRRQLWIPPGFAHGFLTLEAPADVVYKVTERYDPEGQRSLRWNDPAVGISWPLEDDPVLSARDRVAPLLAEAEGYS